jgi:uncharacterized membrane protein YbhN (UPF0104 family)
MKKQIQIYGKLLIKFVFTTGILFIVFRQIPLTRLISLIESVNANYIGLAFLFFIASKFFSSVRQFEIFKNENLTINKRYNHKLYLLGMFYNTFLPGGIGGDGYKIIKIEKDYGYTHKKLLKTVFLDRLSGLAALGNILIVLLIIIYSNKFSVVIFVAGVFINIAFYYLIINNKISKTIYTKKTETLSWCVQLLQCVSAYFILLSLDVHEHINIYILLFLLSSIAALFPLSVGGLGAREYTFMIAASYFSIDSEKAVCVGLLFYLISLIVSLSGIYYVFKSIIKTSDYASS